MDEHRHVGAHGGRGRHDRDRGLEIRGHLARDIVTSELRIADWSTEDDRLPAAPPLESRGIGTVDARFLTEGAILAALHDVIAAAGNGDSIEVIARAIGDRGIVDAMLLAAARGAHLRILLDPVLPNTRAAAGELVHNAAGNVEVRWQSTGQTQARYALIRHRNDVWLDLGSAKAWSRAAAYSDHADESKEAYWRYRLTEATGLGMF